MLSRAQVITSGNAVSRNFGYGVLGVLAVGVASLVQVAVISAQAPSNDAVQVALRVDADARCATTSALAAQVRARSPRIEPVAEAAGVPRIVVAIGGAGSGDRVAELSVAWPDGRRSERRLTAASCTAALEALSLLVAMTLDPTAFGSDDGDGDGNGTDAVGASAASDDASGRAASGDDATSADAASGDAVAPLTPAADADSEPESSPRAQVDADERASRAHPLGIEGFAAGASALVLSGLAPRVMPGVGVYARLSLNGDGLLAPALQLQLAHSWASELSEAGGDADFALDAAALDLCPFGLRLPPFAVHACFAATLGRLTASGSNSYAPRTQHALWSSLGGRLSFVVGLAPWLELQAGLGLPVPLQRYRFAFRPDVFHRVPALCLEGQLGAGVRFP